MPMLSLGQAARLAGVGKTTISRAIASGRLSAGRNDDGGYEIDPAELARVYTIKLDAEGKPAGKAEGKTGQADDLTPSQKAELEAMLSVLEERIQGLKSTLESERKRADAAEADRDRWARQAENIAGLLPAPEGQGKEKPGLFSRVFGRKAG